ncbi:hypothetical protein Ddye_025939 [Dipteronia dyeriana]|uniref:Uncharacterized protein n=1 Tax=Dipteronia dyeriana TaxID=168575 RepID=A0AAD9WNP0_9ROSI|nr:hypothetical protein Ddye_025939 [Dipteronia dyeriana]
MRNRLRDLLKTPEEDWYEGKLTRHDHFDTLGHIDDVLNWVPKQFAEEDRRWFMVSCFWHFLTMHREMKFLGGVIHRLLLRELNHKSPTDEMQFMLGNQSVRFSKVEFCLITGLRFGVIPDTSVYAEVENGIHQRPATRTPVRSDLPVVLFGSTQAQLYPPPSTATVLQNSTPARTLIQPQQFPPPPSISIQP